MHERHEELMDTMAGAGPLADLHAFTGIGRHCRPNGGGDVTDHGHDDLLVGDSALAELHWRIAQ